MNKLKSATKTQELYGALIVIKSLVGIYEFMQDDNREGLKLVLELIFPFLENLAINQLSNWNDESAKILTIILKCTGMAIFFKLEEYFAGAVLTSWMVILKGVIDRPVPEHLCKKQEDWNQLILLDGQQEWKLRKAALQTVAR